MTSLRNFGSSFHALAPRKLKDRCPVARGHLIKSKSLRFLVVRLWICERFLNLATYPLVSYPPFQGPKLTFLGRRQLAPDWIIFLSRHMEKCGRQKVASCARNTYVMGNRWKNMAAKRFTATISAKVTVRFIITGKSVLYFKSSGKVKSKWPIAGRLWILF